MTRYNDPLCFVLKNDGNFNHPLMTNCYNPVSIKEIYESPFHYLIVVEDPSDFTDGKQNEIPAINDYLKNNKQLDCIFKKEENAELASYKRFVMTLELNNDRNLLVEYRTIHHKDKILD